jgi:hypothetical protein
VLAAVCLWQSLVRRHDSQAISNNPSSERSTSSAKAAVKSNFKSNLQGLIGGGIPPFSAVSYAEANYRVSRALKISKSWK